MLDNSNIKRIIEMIDISKAFPGIQAVDKVDFTLESGCVHAIVGENGAGKSTLMKVLAGIHKRDSGSIKIDGKEVEINEPLDAKNLGISMIEQEFSLFPEMSVFQNIFMGREYSRRMKFFINWKNIKKKTLEMLKDLGLSVNINVQIKKLKTSDHQLVEIAHAIFFGASFIIMDEPTSSLGEEEKQKLFSIIRNLKKSGVGIIYISHRMEEIFDIADIVTIMRDGNKIVTHPISEVDEAKLIKLMVGRDLSDIFNRKKEKIKKGKTVLKVEGLSRKGVFDNISFEVKEGEILGLSGLLGSKRTEIVRCIFGMDKLSAGKIFFDGRELKLSNPMQAINNGIGMVPEDRKKDGLLSALSVKNNISIAMLKDVSRFGWISNRKERKVAYGQVSDLDIKIVSLEQPITKLSGGNQQKVILGRFLALKPKLLILDEPTRGIDVGAKAEVHRIISEIVKHGVAVIMISSELPEVLGACDRILVLHNGRITDEYNFEEANQEKLLQSALK